MSVNDGPAGMSSTCEAALTYAARGWPVFPLQPRAKTPATQHGFEDASTDPDQIRRWWPATSPANIAIVTGAPGPQVVDVDAPEHFPPELAAQLMAVSPPMVATARGTHYYFAGTTESTITLRAGDVKYGELRGVGSYVVAPPSVHPTGKLYVWTSELNGGLPGRPIELGDGDGRGAGVLELVENRIGHGERHDFLNDIAIRLVRGGILDENLIITSLKAAFTERCDPSPAPRTNEFRDHAKWALGTRIAGRERTKAKKEERTESGLPFPPERDAPLAEHRDYITAGGGWGPHVNVKDVTRYGTRDDDALEIYLDNGLVIEFPRQAEVTARAGWNRRVVADTQGIGWPPAKLKDWERFAIYRSLCILAATPQTVRERADLEDVIGDLLALCEPLLGHTLRDSSTRYKLIEDLRGREPWDPRDRNTQGRPVQIYDAEDDERYLRAGELQAWCWKQPALQIGSGAFPGRMAMAGLNKLEIWGREPTTDDRTGKDRRRNRATLYRLPTDT